MGHRPFRFGIQIGGAPTRAELIELIRRAEGSGFEVVTTADHISARLAVMPLLATAAQLSSMRVSSMVVANDYRHPVVVARDAATIDILSEGRFELGIGTGWIAEQYRAVGLSYDQPKTRVDRFEEAVTIIKGCWTGEPFSFTGRHYQIKDLTSTRPHQRPHPPLLIAGSGKRMLTLAGKEADIVDICPLARGAATFHHLDQSLGTSRSRIEDQIEWIRKGAGARFDDIELSVMAHELIITHDVDDTTSDLAESWGSTAEAILESPHVFVGSVNALVETIQERRERYGISYIVFLAADLTEVEPVVRQLAGT